MQPFAFIDRTEPVSPGSKTPTPGRDLGHRENRSSSELRALGSSVYKEVWEEFYTWEPGYCSHILGTLDGNPLAPAKDAAVKMAKDMMAGLLEDTHQGNKMDQPENDWETAYLTRYRSIDGKGFTTTVEVTMPFITIDVVLPPHPAYESCPPISKSMRLDETREHTANYLPYGDDETFPFEEYLAKFPSLEWANDFDPDLEMIQLETVRRLHVIQEITLPDVDRMRIFKSLRFSHNTGLLWERSQRDFLHWPGAFQVKPEDDLPTSHAAHTDDLRGRLLSTLRTFCPTLNCLSPICETHGQLNSNTYLPSRRPQITGQSMLLSEGEPCGPECFRLVQDFDQFVETLPPSPSDSSNVSSLDTLETILSLAPDLYPCQLAVLCFRSCQETFVQRLHLWPDHSILPLADRESSFDPSTDADTERDMGELGKDSALLKTIQQRKKNKKMKTKLEFVDEPSHLSCEQIPPCAHSGACTSSQCQCWLKKQHCTPACRCGVSCTRQWPSCSCVSGRCEAETCSCVQGGRECIPGICLRCDAGGHTGRPCRNTKVQRQASKPLEIRPGTYGLGAFALESLNMGDFVGTYTGHIMSLDSANLTIDITNHNSLNYLFEVTPDKDNIQLPVFDAACVGNATRFLNHGKAGKDNVEARTLLVNGEHQIGFFTKRKVKARDELFLDYGQNYWKEQGGHYSESESE
ncbi:hypothetical protein HYDPIDRAFT_132965 [Hydnomerulius pinastri MD-312]|uniref:SET domain-containing protein n=1 Tax=Hydnomerulius pinastri MD-312 TaxID=994086 RepID=A0A0C9WFK8_9AGAM|nr:hypothetical protein HYDPIDRAFT_132965 [Hydnomerulius pinastri MD-312]